MTGDPIDRLLAVLREPPPSETDREHNIADYGLMTAHHDHRYEHDPEYRASFDDAAREPDAWDGWEQEEEHR